MKLLPPINLAGILFKTPYLVSFCGDGNFVDFIPWRTAFLHGDQWLERSWLSSTWDAQNEIDRAPGSPAGALRVVDQELWLVHVVVSVKRSAAQHVNFDSWITRYVKRAHVPIDGLGIRIYWSHWKSDDHLGPMVEHHHHHGLRNGNSFVLPGDIHSLGLWWCWRYGFR